MSRMTLWTMLILTLAVLASGIGVIYSKYLSRKIFAQLQAINSDCNRAETRWTRLQLEEGSLISYSRVENHARNRLGLHIPVSGEIHVLR